MTDERFTEFLRRVAQDHHPPPATPREAMWARIDAERRKRRRRRSRRTWHPTLAWPTAAAAVLLIGITIGRVTAPGGGAETDGEFVVAGEATEEGDALIYRVAAINYLVRSDEFLSLFRSEASLGTADAEVGEWARDLLLTTQLMMDSPVMDADATLRALLEDLELVLVQIAQYARSQDRTELELIERGLDNHALQLRLRAALAAEEQVLVGQGAI